MSGLAALSTGVFVALLVGLLSGGLPTLQRTTGPRGPSRLAVQLQQAGVGWTPLQVRVATAVGAVLTMVVVAAVTGIPAMAVVPGVLVLAAPQALLRRRALARVRAVREAWPDALAMIGGSVRSGRPLSHAVVDVSLDGPVALRGPMAGLAARIQTVGMVPALQAVADAIADATTAGRMPPWHVEDDGSCRSYVGGPTITDDQIALLAAWAEAGAPEGDSAPPPEIPAPETLDDISVTLDPGVAYENAADDDDDDYRCFVVDPGLTTDRFLTAYQVHPGVERLVHHVSAERTDGLVHLFISR